MPEYPSDQLGRFQIRLPTDWRDTIKALAAKNRRSMNAEILAALEGHVQPHQREDQTAA
ncbi:Arc family DNA-binding protein [Cereibacter azotoformans]|uniref:Arc family DNA-binding protein n=1 Tax=Cereibacter azotoformans TaxID=43057 RepID=UPI001EEAFDB1|nr:Arc family DNA-binding protein [Cereibacter azotoformans]ULB09131.1 Arc family DNA-binding protein [Cereibacter azotoformans]